MFIGTEIELFAADKLILWATAEVESAEEILKLAVPVPLMFLTLKVPLAGIVVLTFGAKVNPILLFKIIGPERVNELVDVVASVYPLVLK